MCIVSLAVRSTVFASLTLAACTPPLARESSVETPPSPVTTNAVAYVTAQDGHYVRRVETLTEVGLASPPADVTLTLDTTRRYQPIEGFGFTLTGGSAGHLLGMSPAARAALLRRLFGRGEGQAGVSFLRLSVGASDLDAEPWSYDDLPAGQTDTALTRFSLGRDTAALLPVLREILAIAPEIGLMASPWSPPVWMKDNGDTRGGSLRPEFEPAYARYLARYLGAMRAVGVEIDLLTVQNEPLHPGNNPSVLMLAAQQARFVGEHLGPELARRGLSTKIVVYDHNADRPDYPLEVLADARARPYVHGSAFHLYAGPITSLSSVRAAHPDKAIYFTEQWVGAPGDFAGDFGWHIEHLMIGATRNWARTVLEWNLTSNPTLTPHTDRGGCDRCLGAVTIDGDAVTLNPAYHTIAQASAWVPPGAVRIESGAEPAGLGQVAFLVDDNPGRRVVTLLQNRRTEDVTVDLGVGGVTRRVVLPKGGVGTVVIGPLE